MADKKYSDIMKVSSNTNFTYEYKSDSFTIADNATNQGYLVDSSNNSVNITLPTNCNVGDTLYIKVVNYSNSISILRNGHKIVGVEDNLDLNKDSELYLIYADVSFGWNVLLSQYSQFQNWYVNLLASADKKITWSVINSSQQLEPNKGYFVDASTGAVICTLPDNPALGDRIFVKPIDMTNTITIARNGKKIESKNEDITVDADVNIGLSYTNEINGWAVILT